jgi:hypothetical protein
MTQPTDKKDKPDQPGFVTVYVSTEAGDVPYKIHPGSWQVPKLKVELKIAEELLLVELSEPIVKHADDSKVVVKDGQIFIGQSRGGGAS